MTLNAHPLCEILPPLTAAEFSALKEDIARNGLVREITLYEGMILDGRHRYKACVESSVEPRFVEYKGSDPAGFVGSSCLHRSLTAAQRGLIALGFLDYEKAQAKARQVESGKVHGRGKVQADQPRPIDNAIQSRDAAGERVGVNGRTVDKVRKVAETAAPELIQKMRRGEIALHEAAEIAKSSISTQKRIIELPDQRSRSIAMRKAQAQAASAKAKHERLSNPPQVAQPSGSNFLRVFLGHAERMAINLREYNLKTAEDIAEAFLNDMDFGCVPLAMQYDRCKPVIDAFKIIEERKPNA